MSSQVIEKLKDKPRLYDKFVGRFMPFDHVILVYCWIIIVLTINFARPISNYLDVLFFHFGMILLVCLLSQFARKPARRLVVFIRLLYPVLMMTFFYQFSGRLVQVVFQRWFDGQLVGLEKSILGFHPTLWLDQHLNIVATELLSAAYFSYYFLIPGLALFLFFGKRDGEIRRFMTATCVTFFISYLMFIFYPVVGPRFYFAELYQNDITGIFFRPLVDFVIYNGAFKGGAMPSSHCAEALIVMLFAIRNYGRRAYFLIFVVIGLSMGTVYGRFHYVSDVIFGVALAIAVYWFTLKFYPTKKDYAPRWQLSDFDKKRMYVSDSV